ncbi:hypothetical protein ALC62_08011 [Cyphomyrmex costatus]|uniref:Uncharacterized protein n=1 Tax=Cyphomyrmex costatus TaxID=456900 RepID=A0A195CM63_9HYME|nr:hypothetical protein ALC62_08011 [Cyphomyrmex costatus]
MYLKSCCALFLLALVACQAAPSSQATEKSINEAETMLTKSNIELEGTGAEKDRAKKSATTFCVEVRSGKTEKVPCKEIRPQGIVQQETSKPVVIVQPISIPAPVPVPAPAPTIIEYPKQPIVIQQQQRPIQPHLIPPPVPTCVPIKSPPTPAISVPCDKPIVQPTQPQIHTIHVIHPTQQPPIHEVKPCKPIFKPQQSIVQVPTVCKKCNKQIPVPKFPSDDAFAYPIFSPFEQRTDCEVGPYECNCRPENRIVEITPYKIKDPRMANPDGATIDSLDTVSFNSIPHRSSMISTEYDPSTSNIMLDQSMILDSKGVRKAEERTHHKHYLPVNLNVQFPIAYGTDNTPYQPQNYPSYPSYPSPNSYIYPSSYGSYETYGTSYPINYDSLASSNNVPAVTVNAGGPFYNPRESQHSDSSSRPNNEAQPRAFSTDIQSNHEQKEITQTNKGSVIKEVIPEPNVVTIK